MCDVGGKKIIGKQCDNSSGGNCECEKCDGKNKVI